MVRDGCCWWHVVINSCGSWLPGDSRGFRSRDHRIHSSGDYHHRPPAGEHAGLLSYATARTGREVHFSADQRMLLGQAILRSLASADVPCIAAAVSANNAVVISIAAGVTIASMQARLRPKAAIVRCMPNTPALLQCGASGLFANANCSSQQRDFAQHVANISRLRQPPARLRHLANIGTATHFRFHGIKKRRK